MKPTKRIPTGMFILNAVVYMIIGAFGIVSSLRGAQGAASAGAPVTAFWVGTAGAVALLLLGVGMLIWVRSKNAKKG